MSTTQRLTRTPLIVFGIDGAEPTLVERWTSEGKLPTLSKVLSRAGGMSRLRSTPNALSPSAWSSFITGLNPGRHGVFYFLDRVPGEHRFEFKNAANRHGDPFWQFLGQAGVRTALLHVPFTYPAAPMNGIQVSGWLTPTMHSPGFTHPPGLAGEIARQFPKFKLHSGLKEYVARGRYDRALDSKLQSIADKTAMNRLLLESEDFDLVVVVFEEADQIQHFFWHSMDAEHPEHNEAEFKSFGDAILRTYQAIDSALADLLELFGEDADVLILSDHGFKADTWGHLFIEPALRVLGYEGTVKPGVASRARHVSYDLIDRYAPESVKHLLNRMMQGTRQSMLAKNAFRSIDWASTRAFSLYMSRDAQIWINLAGREPFGTVRPEEYDGLCDELAELFLEATETETGRRPVREVIRKEDVFEGPYVDTSPDLILKWERGLHVRGLQLTPPGRSAVRVETHLDEPYRTGIHDDDGIFIDATSNPYKSSAGRLELIDVPAYIHALLDVPVPSHYDADACPFFLEGRAPHVDETKTSTETPERDGYSRADEELIADRLRDLGYL